MNAYFLCVNADGQLAAYRGGYPEGLVSVLRTKQDVIALFSAAADAGVPVTCSSSLDFPEEDTDDQAVIDLCAWIRNGGDA